MIGRATAALLAASLLLATGFGLGHAQALRGVNLAGAAYSASKLPGTYGRDFVYPKADEVAYFTAKGMNVFRISVLWERLQPSLMGPLDPRELSRLSGFIDEARQHGASTIIDLHDYGRYRGTAIDQGGATSSAFADIWSRLATRFGHQDDILFDLMNEPQLPDARHWADIEQQAINAIRATGAGNRILVSGVGWDGAYNFASVNGAALIALRDPRHRLAFEVHQYFDQNSSGTNDGCIDPDQAVKRLASFTQWLRANHQQGFLGEFGVSRRPECLQVLDHVMANVTANASLWLGWTYWAAGPLWGNYMFTLEPDHGQDRPQMGVLEKYLDAKAP